MGKTKPSNRQHTPRAGKVSRKLKRKEETIKINVKSAKAKAVVETLLASRRVSARAAARLAAGADKPIPRYFAEPQYGLSHIYSGATEMRVLIGPAQALPANYGSVPDASTPQVMRELLDGEYNNFGWIAGHLLNDNLGGPGVARNLTPLTTAGNKNHLNGCEAAIKNYIDRAFSRTWQHRGEAYWYGVEYRVKVGDGRWAGEDEDRDPLQHVATELRVWVKAIRMRKSDDSLSDVPATDAMYLAPLVDFAIDNTGYDQI